jgi:hypothetical protein
MHASSIICFYIFFPSWLEFIIFHFCFNVFFVFPRPSGQAPFFWVKALQDVDHPEMSFIGLPEGDDA